jgi:diguanylate cyclase
MVILPAAIVAYLLVNLLCACVALVVGFVAGVWICSSKLANMTHKGSPPAQDDAAQRAAERTAMAASRVADLARYVASDVGDHSAKIKAISSNLEGINQQTAGMSELVATALAQVILANTNLQQKLDDAEKQLNKQAEELRKNETQARTDSLTGLLNRRAFDDELKRRLNQWQRMQVLSTLMLLDLDHFKKLNDTHGHQVGDEVLRQVAKVIKAEVREMDLPCRYGGEEFAVIFPSTDVASACNVAERIRLAIEEATTVTEGKTFKVTCCIGLSQFITNDDVTRLIKRADEALYTSKRAGRNCGHWHDGAKCLPISAPPTVGSDQNKQPKTPAKANRFACRESFLEMLKPRVEESHRLGVPISLIYLKMEDYDFISRMYGKITAGQMIDTAVSAMDKVLPETGTLVRFEAGEVAVLLPGKTQAEAELIDKQMRLATNRCLLPMLDRDLRLRFSHAFAELRPRETADELLNRAEQAVAALSEKSQPAEV